MGVATLITVMTLVQGANLYVEQKIANLGTNVFRLAKTPFAVVDFTVVVKALKNKNIDVTDYQAVAGSAKRATHVGASASGTLSLQYQNKQADDTSIIGYTPNMVDIDTRTLDLGRYFTTSEDQTCGVCLHHWRLAGRSILSRCESDWPQHPHREPGIHGHRHVSEARFGAGPGSGQFRNYSAYHVPEGARRAVQPDARNQSRRAGRRISMPRRTRRA